MPDNTNITPHLVTIEDLSHDGRGLATIHGKKAFIAGALPGEQTTIRLTKKRSHYYEAQAVDITQASKERVSPPCKHYGICGGCNLQHMNMNLQLKLKQTTLLNQLQHFGNVTPSTILPPLDEDSLGYRHKARLGAKFVTKKNKMLVGFREKSSRYLAMLEKCVVLHPKIGNKLSALSDLIGTLKAYQHIPQIEVAVGDSDVALVFRHLENLSADDKEKLRQFGRDTSFHVYLQPNKPEKISKLWPEDLLHRLKYSLPQQQLSFLFHPLDFTQINLKINRSLVNAALSLLEIDANDNVLDLFCGVGNFTLPLARSAKYVIGIEGSETMVRRAYENAAYNQIMNVEFHAVNLDETSHNNKSKSSWLNATYDKILLDPPRLGAKNILPHLKQFAAKRILYVSCNPATLARDAGIIVHEHGYTLLSVGIANMFPHTSHVEAIALFTKD